MATQQRLVTIARRVLPWVAAWMALQALLAIAGRLMGRRLDEGDELSTSIRRVKTVGALQLRPTNPALTSLHIDLGMGGCELDLSGIGEPARGVDLTVHVLMGGLAVRVPPDWRVWWSFRGIGGIGADHGLLRSPGEHEADLRVHATVLMGGVGIEAAKTGNGAGT